MARQAEIQLAGQRVMWMGRREGWLAARARKEGRVCARAEFNSRRTALPARRASERSTRLT